MHSKTLLSDWMAEMDLTMSVGWSLTSEVSQPTYYPPNQHFWRSSLNDTVNLKVSASFATRYTQKIPALSPLYQLLLQFL